MPDLIINRNFPESIMGACIRGMRPDFNPSETPFVEDPTAAEGDLDITDPLQEWDELIAELEFHGDYLEHTTPVLTAFLGRGLTITKKPPICLEKSMPGGDDGFRSFIKYYNFDVTDKRVQNTLSDLIDQRVLEPLEPLSELGAKFDYVVAELPPAE